MREIKKTIVVFKESVKKFEENLEISDNYDKNWRKNNRKFEEHFEYELEGSKFYQNFQDSTVEKKAWQYFSIKIRGFFVSRGSYERLERLEKFHSAGVGKMSESFSRFDYFRFVFVFQSKLNDYILYRPFPELS